MDLRGHQRVFDASHLHEVAAVRALHFRNDSFFPTLGIRQPNGVARLEIVQLAGQTIGEHLAVVREAKDQIRSLVVGENEFVAVDDDLANVPLDLQRLGASFFGGNGHAGDDVDFFADQRLARVASHDARLVIDVAGVAENESAEGLVVGTVGEHDDVIGMPAPGRQFRHAVDKGQHDRQQPDHEGKGDSGQQRHPPPHHQVAKIVAQRHFADHHQGPDDEHRDRDRNQQNRRNR